MIYTTSCQSNINYNSNTKTTTSESPTTSTTTITTTEPEFTHELKFANYIDEYYRYNEMSLYDKDNLIPLYNCKTNFSNSWSGEALMRMNNAVGIIELSGRVKLHLETNFKINDNITIRPISKNVIFEASEKSVDFIIEDVGDYTLEFPLQRTLHLFVYEIDDEKYDDAINFSSGIHNKDNSSYIDNNSVINVKSNTIKIYIKIYFLKIKRRKKIIINKDK